MYLLSKFSKITHLTFSGINEHYKLHYIALVYYRSFSNLPRELVLFLDLRTTCGGVSPGTVRSTDISKQLLGQ